MNHLTATWRVGRSVGRTVYAMTGPTPSKDDILIGVMDTRDLAAEVVESHNAAQDPHVYAPQQQAG